MPQKPDRKPPLLLERIARSEARLTTTLGGLQLPGFPDEAILAISAAAAASDLPRYVADTVSEYYFAGTTQDTWVPRDFAPLVPSAPLLWIECARPSVVRSDIFGTRSSTDYPRRWGVLFFTIRKQPKWLLGVLAGADPTFGASCAGGTRLLLQRIVLELDDGSVVVVPMTRVASIDDRGVEVAARWCIESPLPPSKDVELVTTCLTGLLHPLMLAIRFMNENRVNQRQETSDGAEAPHTVLGPVSPPSHMSGKAKA